MTSVILDPYKYDKYEISGLFGKRLIFLSLNITRLLSKIIIIFLLPIRQRFSGKDNFFSN